jgi:hypothetical protein
VTQDGLYVVYDVNGYPGVVPCWSGAPVFRRRAFDVFAALAEERCRGS